MQVASSSRVRIVVSGFNSLSGSKTESAIEIHSTSHVDGSGLRAQFRASSTSVTVHGLVASVASVASVAVSLYRFCSLADLDCAINCLIIVHSFAREGFAQKACGGEPDSRLGLRIGCNTMPWVGVGCAHTKQPTNQQTQNNQPKPNNQNETTRNKSKKSQNNHPTKKQKRHSLPNQNKQSTNNELNTSRSVGPYNQTSKTQKSELGACVSLRWLVACVFLFLDWLRAFRCQKLSCLRSRLMSELGLSDGQSSSAVKD